MTVFLQKQQQFKRGIQEAIEKESRDKQTREGHVVRECEKYGLDCVWITSYTTQSTDLMRDLEVHLIPGSARQTVQANDITRAIHDMTTEWEQGWIGFSYWSQFLEEERIKFMKDNLWAYANVVSTVCVSDDEVRMLFSCRPASISRRV